ncbi:MAG: guanylate cyclase, partial [Azoarcus sp.]|nr:guanylate cyclase [Azoarcus sp.]
MTSAADWDAFAAAPTADARARAWLALLADRLPGLRAGVLLIENPADKSYLPLAVWPAPGQTTEPAPGQEAISGPGPNPNHLAAVVEAALQTRRNAVKTTPDGLTQLAYPLWAGERIAGIVALETAIPEREAASLLREIHWGAAWLTNLFIAREHTEALAAKERLGAVLETAALALKSGRELQETLIDLANALCRQLACTRVAIGLVKRATVRLAALSDTATFEKRAPLTQGYERAMAEAHDAHR